MFLCYDQRAASRFLQLPFHLQVKQYHSYSCSPDDWTPCLGNPRPFMPAGQARQSNRTACLFHICPCMQRSSSCHKPGLLGAWSEDCVVEVLAVPVPAG